MRWTLETYREKPLLAKSEVYGAVSLEDHLEHVAMAVESVAGHIGKDIKLAKKGALLHDIGKAHPTYQGFVHGYLGVHDLTKGLPHRHEISSLAFLSLVPREEWEPLTEMIVAHHKSVMEDSRDRGVLDMVNRYRIDGLMESHLKDWEIWSPRALDILDRVGFSTHAITEVEARQSLEWVVDYCDGLEDGWSEWKGMLMASDHMASALAEDLKPRLPYLFRTPEFREINDPSPLYPLSAKPTDDERPHTLVLAPTGAGKTDFLLKRCQGRVFYVLPFQASINAMFKRIKEIVSEDTDVRLLHAASRLVADDDPKQEVQLQPFVGANVKVLTPHQISNIIFGSMGFEANLIDLKSCDVILDEVHTYQAETQAMVVEIVKVLLRNGCRVHVGTATMPTALYDKLLNILGGPECVYEVQLTEKELQTYDRHIIYKHEEFEELLDVITEALESKEKLLLVFNTVKVSQEAYQKLLDLFPDVPSMLIHSRFRRKDRRDREVKLEEEFNKGEGPCFVVSTQVVEVSLDINFDRMITEAAPLDSLIQRFGRINRKRFPEKERMLKPIHVIKPGERTLPYDKETVCKSYDLLPDGEKLKTVETQKLIDEVYPEIVVPKISGWCRWGEDRLELKKLRHISEPMLLKLLEIDLATCILQQDQEAYEQAGWEERQWLEIPVNQKSLYRIEDHLWKAEGGSEPYVMSDQDLYEQIGLELKEPSNFIF